MFGFITSCWVESCPTSATPWTVVYQATVLCPWGFSGQEYWSWLPVPSAGDLPNPGIKPGSSALQGDSLPTELRGKPSLWVAILNVHGFF